ncbi:MAG: FAD-dependent oxidoreductase [Clostridia bacterium]|nr:FAD-dependent oxidoreductase [Clostridia bacterium]
MWSDASLTGVRRADAAIVGGSLTGLLTAAGLGRAGWQVAVLEAGTPGSALPETLCAHPWAAYASIVSHTGLSQAQTHARLLQQLCRELPEQLSPLTPLHGTERYAFALLPQDEALLQEYLGLAKALGLPAQEAPDAGGCPFPVERSVLSRDVLLMDAPRLVQTLIARIRRSGGQVYSGSAVTELASGRVFTALGRVDAPVVILACGRPPGLRELLRLESRTIVRCRMTGGAPLFSVQQSLRPGALTLTPATGGLEAAWCAGRTGARPENERVALFRRILRARMPDYAPEALHFSQTCVPMDGLPLIGESRAWPGRTLLCCGIATVAESALAAAVTLRRLLGRPEPSDALYHPDRSRDRALARQRLRRLRAMRTLNALRRSVPRCSLCGCRLRWCTDGERWGCPVCGSVFSMMGRRIGGPAVRDTQASPRQRPGW